MPKMPTTFEDFAHQDHEIDSAEFAALEACNELGQGGFGIVYSTLRTPTVGCPMKARPMSGGAYVCPWWRLCLPMKAAAAIQLNFMQVAVKVPKSFRTDEEKSAFWKELKAMLYITVERRISTVVHCYGWSMLDDGQESKPVMILKLYERGKLESTLESMREQGDYDAERHGDAIIEVAWAPAGKSLSQIEFTTIATSIAHGLAELHSDKLVVQDLKSDNVLLDSEGRAVLADLGLLRIAAQPGTAGGSPLYL